MEEAMSGSCGDSASSGSGSTVVDQDNHDHENHDQMVGNEIEGYDESELELGLGLNLGPVGSQSQNNNHQIPKFFNAKNNAKIGNSFNVGAGTKRAASPTGPSSQVVGWPPIRVYRMNNMANQAKSISTTEHSSKFDETKHKNVVHGTDGKGKTTPQGRVPVRSSLFVKVNMDGAAIGRKVDLKAHTGYESLAQTLEEMFIDGAAETESHSNELKLMPKATRPSKLLDGSSDFLLTYEDKDGDWMLVGDVPWGMFLGTVKRLRILRTSECNALATRLEERSTKQRSRPI